MPRVPVLLKRFGRLLIVLPTLASAVFVPIGSVHSIDSQKIYVHANGEDLLPVAEWFHGQRNASISNMLANISPPPFRGAVAASPSGRYGHENPNYFYHWVRDAGLVMDVVRGLYERTEPGSTMETQYERLMWDWIHFERRLQNTHSLTGLGEPKYYMNGDAYNEPWGRPQYDGAAIRASTIMRFALSYVARNISASDGELRLKRVKQELYDSKMPSMTVIKTDLEYVAQVYKSKGFDLWEEVYAYHFYTRMVQRRALIEGAKFAEIMSDYGAAQYYRSSAERLTYQIHEHWDKNRGYIYENLDRSGGLDWKSSGLDVAALLASLHTHVTFQVENPLTYEDDDFYKPTSDILLSHSAKLMEVFGGLYPVNQDMNARLAGAGVGIGRYPEDRYDGTGMSAGNPWFLATFALSEQCFRLALEMTKRGFVTVTPDTWNFWRGLVNISQDARWDDIARGQSVTITKESDAGLFGTLVQAVQARGEAFVRRVQYHSPRPNGLFINDVYVAPYSLWEQFNRVTGFMQSARDLTWSYASSISASWWWTALKKAAIHMN